MFCGPRDQYETWQGLPSATPANRYFAFSHVLDGGWTGGHYCRSWELLGLNQFGPIVNVDKAAPPYGDTRRLITDADCEKRARTGAQFSHARQSRGHGRVWKIHSRGCLAIPLHAPRGKSRPAGAK